MQEGSNQYTVVLGERAKELLTQDVRFVAQKSVPGAESLRAAIISALKSLEHFPDRYPWLSDPLMPPFKHRKMVVDSHYLILYQVKGTVVYVDFIVDCRSDYKWLL